MSRLPIRCALLACVALAAACQTRVATFTGPTMGTTYHVSVADSLDVVRRGQAQTCIDQALQEATAHLSTYEPASEISRINADKTLDWIEISPVLHAVLVTAQRIGLESDGAFDVTVAPLIALWGFGSAATARGLEAFAPPSAEAIAKARDAVGPALLELRETPAPALRKRVAGLRLDVDGIAPGFAVDRIAGCFAAVALENFLVEIGGEIRGHGRRPDGRPWRVAIEAPQSGERVVQAGIDLEDMAVSTSGDYRDFRVTTAGARFGHTIDPRTGHPITHALASVTVLHESAAAADAYATAMLVLGTEAGHDLALRLGLPVLFLDRAPGGARWQETATPAFERLRRTRP